MNFRGAKWAILGHFLFEFLENTDICLHYLKIRRFWYFYTKITDYGPASFYH